MVVIDDAVKDPTVETFKEIRQEVEGSKKFLRSSNKEIKITKPTKKKKHHQRRNIACFEKQEDGWLDQDQECWRCDG